MADTVLDKYARRRQEYEADFKKGGASVSGLLMYQELLYRLDVLQALQMFCSTAPVGDNFKSMIAHYQMLDGYVNNLVYERQFGVPAGNDPDLPKHRQAAHVNLCRVIESYRKRFSSFKPGEPDQYKREIDKAVLTVLPAWIQYRNVYVSLKQTEEAA